MELITTSNAIILDNQHNVLLVKRAGDSDTGGFWSLPGGTCQKGENKQDALLREIKEELGCSLSSFSFFRPFKISLNEKLVTANYFFCTIESPIVLDNKELSEYKWFKKQEIPDNLAFNQDLVLFEFWENCFGEK